MPSSRPSLSWQSSHFRSCSTLLLLYYAMEVYVLSMFFISSGFRRLFSPLWKGHEWQEVTLGVSSSFSFFLFRKTKKEIGRKEGRKKWNESFNSSWKEEKRKNVSNVTTSSSRTFIFDPFSRILFFDVLRTFKNIL